MLTIEQVSQKTKDRIIQLLTPGVNYDNVQACVMGLASEAVGALTLEQGIEKFGEIRAESIKNNREYATQAMTIYGLYKGEKTIDNILGALGLSSLEYVKTREEMMARLPEVVADTASKFLSKVAD